MPCWGSVSAIILWLHLYFFQLYMYLKNLKFKKPIGLHMTLQMTS